MDERECVESLSPHDLQLDAVLKHVTAHETVNIPKWAKQFRGANGALQWLVTNTRPDLAADTSISAGTSGTGIMKSSSVNAQKLLRKAHDRIDVEIKKFGTSNRRTFALAGSTTPVGPVGRMEVPREAL